MITKSAKRRRGKVSFTLTQIAMLTLSHFASGVLQPVTTLTCCAVCQRRRCTFSGLSAASRREVSDQILPVRKVDTCMEAAPPLARAFLWGALLSANFRTLFKLGFQQDARLSFLLAFCTKAVAFIPSSSLQDPPP